MTSTVDQMRENREVLAQITESQRTIAQVAPEASRELVALAETARRTHTALNRAGCAIVTACLLAGAAGGAVVALVVFWLLQRASAPL